MQKRLSRFHLSWNGDTNLGGDWQRRSRKLSLDWLQRRDAVRVAPSCGMQWRVKVHVVVNRKRCECRSWHQGARGYIPALTVYNTYVREVLRTLTANRITEYLDAVVPKQ